MPGPGFDGPTVSGGAARRRAARRAALLWLVGAGAVLLLRRADLFGDRGMNNVVSGLLLGVFGAGGALAFVLTRWRPWRQRLLALLVGVAPVLALSAAVRVTGVSGEMIPSLAWRWARRPAERSAPVPGAGSAVDLATVTPQDYPGFLGASRDQRVPGTVLARDWSRRPPRLRWRVPCGAGWSAFAVVNGWAVTQEQDEEGEAVTARALATGELAWRTRTGDAFHHVLGGDGPRSTPSIDGGRVYALGAWGRLTCLDGASGAQLWTHDLLAEYGLTRAEATASAQYGRSNSPLVHGDLVIVPAGSDPEERQAGLVAFDKRTGERRWEGPPRQVSYSSPVAATLAGVEQILIVNEASLSGHDLGGALLWEHPWPGFSSGDANVSQAVPLAPDQVFVSKGYGGGGLLVRLVPGEGGTLAARELWRAPRLLRTKMTNVVVHGGFLYGLDDGMLECVELATGEKRWKEGRYGHGQILLVGDVLLVVSEEGEVLALEASPARPNGVFARFPGLAGKSWAAPALAGAVLLLRNAGECAAWELPLAE
jgi:outer membrane protein assembly factor BamB